MRHRALSVLIGLSLVWVASRNARAESTLVSIFLEPEWPSTPTPGSSVTYKVTAVSREGQGLLEVNLSVAGLPEGTTYSFSPNILRFTGRVPLSQTSYLTITCPTVMPIDSYAFSVTGTAQRETVVYTNPPIPPFSGPPLLTIAALTNGTVVVRGRGIAGETYQIQSASDPAQVTWDVVGATTADGNSRFSVFPAQRNDSAARFYRALWMPR